MKTDTVVEARKIFERKCVCGTTMRTQELVDPKTLPHVAICPNCGKYYECNAFYSKS